MAGSDPLRDRLELELAGFGGSTWMSTGRGHNPRQGLKTCPRFTFLAGADMALIVSIFKKSTNYWV